MTSGVVGFVSFLAYFGYGYPDTRHGVATAVLAPLFTVGLICFAAANCVGRKCGTVVGLACMVIVAAWSAVCRSLVVAFHSDWNARWRVDHRDCRNDNGIRAGRRGVHGNGASGAERHQRAVGSADAHDRAGFGGAVCCCGVILVGAVWRGEFDRAGRQALALAGIAGFSTAIGVHPAIGYTDWWHLAPAVAVRHSS